MYSNYFHQEEAKAKQDAQVQALRDDWAKKNEVIKGQTAVELAVSAVRQIASAESSTVTSVAMMRVMQLTLARVKAGMVGVTAVAPVVQVTAPLAKPSAPAREFDVVVPVEPSGDPLEPAPELINRVEPTELNMTEVSKKTNASAGADLLSNLQYEQQVLAETISGLVNQIKVHSPVIPTHPPA